MDIVARHFKYAILHLRFLLYPILIFLCTTWLSAQDVYVPSKIPAKSSKALDDAVLAAATGHIDAPIKIISDLIMKHPAWTLPRQKLSEIYYKAGRKSEAIVMLESSIAIDTASQIRQLYSLGRLYEETDKPENALRVYHTIIEKGKDSPDLVKKATLNLTQLEKKMDLWRLGANIIFTPFPSDINTPHNEYLGRWTLDGREFIFTRRFNEQEDIFLTTFEKNKVIEVKDFSFNTSGNEAAQTISPDGKYLVFTSCGRPDGMGGCDLYISKRKDGTWNKPVNMGSPINTPSWDSQPCFGLDGQTIYFSSNRAGGKGGSDIWFVRLQPNGKWSSPVNAGEEINTSDSEESPFIHFDGRTIYFMRNGKDGLGGFDLYFSRLGIDGKWKTPDNMKAPINTGADEGALSLHPDGRTAIITRMTENQLNDLFEFQLPPEYLSSPMQALEVLVTDAETKLPLHARLEVFEVTGHDTIRNSQWADDHGMITMALDRNKSYGLIASAEEYLMHSVHLQADTASRRKMHIELNRISSAIDKTVVLENIFFSTGSAALLPESGAELNKLYQTLLTNPGMNIELRGHTDNVGSDESNMQLSEARAKSVYQYLVDRGINASRLSFKGFGETQPVAGNETEDGRRQNRRTEFFVSRI
ncbi:MAG TPA: OmpA family protein [Saprospiraceae bacterium]|nr:OmpA family protein [Saprospiraceae bacterium]